VIADFITAVHGLRIYVGLIFGGVLLYMAYDVARTIVADIDARLEEQRQAEDAANLSRELARFRRQFAAETNLHNWLASRDDYGREVIGLGGRADWYGDVVAEIRALPEVDAS
jgi:hypothetical protein